MCRHPEFDRPQINRIFWGLILIHFHININRFDLLPDFVGYILFYLALDHLTVNVPEYKVPKALALVLAIFAAANQLMGLAGGIQQRTLLIIWGVLTNLLNAYFDYRLFGCLMDTAEVYQLSLRQEALGKLRIARLVCNLTATVIGLVPNDVLQASVLVVGLVVAIIAIVTVRGLWRDLGELEA